MPGQLGSPWYNPYDPSALQAGAQAQQQQQQLFQQVTQAGRPVYGAQFQVNPRGAPLFGPITGNIWQQSWFYQYPTAAITQRLAEMGYSTHLTNPFTSFATSMAPGLRLVYDILNPPSANQESQAAGFLAFAQQLPQLLLQSPSSLAGTQLSRRAIGQALRNFVPGEQYGDFADQYRLVDDILQNLGPLWLTPTWQRIARQDLAQKLDDYIRYYGSTNAQGMSFLEFLTSTGFIDRYFGR
jgi:hypothetical protein